MIILATETISRRNNLPVELICSLSSRDSQDVLWGVKHNHREYTAETFDGIVEYIRKRKFLTPKQLEGVGDIRCSIEREANAELEKLRQIEAIRNTSEYRGVKELCQIRQQLKFDGLANSERDANKLIELHLLKEIGENLFQFVQDEQARE